jgi:hypothetical protein
MSSTFRTADKVAHTLNRFLGQGPVNPGGVALPTAPPSPINGSWNQAHGQVGSDDCVLTVALDNSVAQTTLINCLWWSSKANQWMKAGANSGVYSKSFEAGGADVFVLPEGVAYYLYGADAIAAGLVYTDGQPPPGQLGT